MKKIKIAQVILACLFLSACAKEQIIPVTADFDIVVVDNDYSVPVKVEIKNKTVGADTYQWIFEGANTPTSSLENPTPIVYLTKGNHKITLKASNKDGAKDEKSIDIQIDAAMKVDFDWEMVGSDVSPVTLQMKNKSEGAITYLWSFEKGLPETSVDEAPKVVFNASGIHKIILKIDNGRENYSLEKTIEVKPAMTIDFDWTVDFVDNDYQAPVLLHLQNKSTNATFYSWSVEGANPKLSNEESPSILLPSAGTYTILLQTMNDKETKKLEKKITVLPNKNLLSFSKIKLGINTAQETIGCFFSSKLGKVIKRSEVTPELGTLIDFGYFGLNDVFSFNQFLSPDEVETTTFLAIPNAIHTKIINMQEVVGVQLSSEEFDKIDDGKYFDKITVNENIIEKSPFTNKTVPRVVLFQTVDGRKGAIKINDFVSSGKKSYILTDIKIQKEK